MGKLNDESEKKDPEKDLVVHALKMITLHEMLTQLHEILPDKVDSIDKRLVNKSTKVLRIHLQHWNVRVAN